MIFQESVKWKDQIGWEYRPYITRYVGDGIRVNWSLAYASGCFLQEPDDLRPVAALFWTSFAAGGFRNGLNGLQWHCNVNGASMAVTASTAYRMLLRS